jgi:hypothetical protein
MRRKHIVSNDVLSQGDHQARSKRLETHVKKKVDAPGRFSASKLGICDGLLSSGPRALIIPELSETIKKEC